MALLKNLPTSLFTPYLLVAAFVSALFFNGIALNWLAVSLLSLLALGVISLLDVYQNGLQLKLNSLSLSISLLLAWFGINIIFNPVTYLGIINFWWVGTLAFSYLIAISLNTPQDFWRRSFQLLVICGVMLAFYAIYQYFFINGQPSASFHTRNSLAALLNLLLFPLLGIFFYRDNHSTLIAAIIFVFIFVIGIVQSRGAGLAALLAFGLFLLMTYRSLDKRKLIQLMVTSMTALVLANIAASYNPLDDTGNLLQQAASLQDIDTAGAPRFRIWVPAWELFLQNTATGIGLGTYYLTIPPTLHPLDTSANFYVHNDYLQIALETGIPGLLFLIAIIFFLFKRTLVVLRSDQEHKIIALSVAAAMVTFFVHSFFTFNFYIMPIIMLAGLYLAYVHKTSIDLLPANTKTLDLQQHMRPVAFYLSLGLFTLVLGNYFITLGLGSYYLNQGIQFASKTQLEKAHTAFLKAQRLTPGIDTTFTSDADLLLKSAIALKNKPKLSTDLLEEAQRKLDRANSLNPLRAQIPYIQASILEQYNPSNPLPVINAYSEALHRNPRYLPARVGLARYLIKRDDWQNADNILRDGIDYTYKQISPAFLDFLALTASSRERAGDYALARQLKARLDYYQREMNKRFTTDQSKHAKPQ